MRKPIHRKFAQHDTHVRTGGETQAGGRRAWALGTTENYIFNSLYSPYPHPPLPMPPSSLVLGLLTTPLLISPVRKQPQQPVCY